MSDADSTTVAPGPAAPADAAPRWFALLPVLAIAAWWPLAPYWQSDDFLALHYASSLERALSDFVGPQYGSTDIWLFYRPLITLSFWFDQLLAGSDPFLSHLSNVLAHGASAVLVALIWRRFLSAPRAFCAGLLWALMPSHIGSIAWAVGRVDSHTVVWCLLTGWLLLRQCERRRAEPNRPPGRWPALLTLTGALLSKELAFIVPPACTLLAFCVARGAPGTRVRFALRESAGPWVVLAIYFGVRLLVLGRFGGYLGSSYDPGPMATGLLTHLANLLVPLRWAGSGAALGADWTGIATLGAAVLLLPAALVALLRPRRSAAALLMFLGTSAPLAAFLAAPDNVHNLRYFYLPATALAGLLAGPGVWFTLLVLLTFLAPFVTVRAEQLDADRQSAGMHAAILRTAATFEPAGPKRPRLFVAGLPHANASGSVVQLHFGVDRMVRPPFAPAWESAREPALYALRPLDASTTRGAFRPWPPAAPRALPGAANGTFAFGPADELTRLAPANAPAARLPDLPLAGDLDESGTLDVLTPRLLAAAARFPAIFDLHEPSFGITTPGVRPPFYRVTIFTANGWICCVVPDHGTGSTGAGPTTGAIDMLRFLVNDPTFAPPGLPHLAGLTAALTSPDPSRLAALDLLVPTTIDLEPEFPTLIEAGSLDAQFRFTPTHRARQLVRLRFDRNYAGWVRLLQGRH